MQAYKEQLEQLDLQIRKGVRDPDILGAYEHTTNIVGLLKKLMEERYLVDMYAAKK